MYVENERLLCTVFGKLQGNHHLPVSDLSNSQTCSAGAQTFLKGAFTPA